jgi:hypothetical protein
MVRSTEREAEILPLRIHLQRDHLAAMGVECAARGVSELLTLYWVPRQQYLLLIPHSSLNGGVLSGDGIVFQRESRFTPAEIGLHPL